MTLDVLFVAKNRLAFTRESFSALVANTNWSLVNTLWVYDDGSTDGTREWFVANLHNLVSIKCIFIDSACGAPAAIMNDYLKRGYTELFAKIDNDVIVPPGWLNACLHTMIENPELDLLGIEPPESRTPHLMGGARSKCPELCLMLTPEEAACGYAKCDFIGGIGLMRRSAFINPTNSTLRPHSIYGGFTEWQLINVNVVKGWAMPPLKVFLLDRLPAEPWASLSRHYIANGWQRAWSGYPVTNPFWTWWSPRFRTFDDIE